MRAGLVQGRDCKSLPEQISFQDAPPCRRGVSLQRGMAVMITVMHPYGLIWRVEEYHRQIKQDYHLEKICLLLSLEPWHMLINDDINRFVSEKEIISS